MIRGKSAETQKASLASLQPHTQPGKEITLIERRTRFYGAPPESKPLDVVPPYPTVRLGQRGCLDCYTTEAGARQAGMGESIVEEGTGGQLYDKLECTPSHVLCQAILACLY